MSDFTLPKGIYGITSEMFSKGRKNIDIVKTMIKCGVKIIQYREKENKTIREKYNECLEIRKITRDNNVIFIINDYIDIAMLVDADGVHIGQEDLPLLEVRKLFPNKIIGISTHKPEDAIEAVKNGADYIGVGPIFKTFTKSNVCNPVGLNYIDFVRQNINLPFVAIGGIKINNIKEVISHGAYCIAMVTEILESDDIEDKLNKINKIIVNS